MIVSVPRKHIRTIYLDVIVIWHLIVYLIDSLFRIVIKYIKLV